MMQGPAVEEEEAEQEADKKAEIVYDDFMKAICA